jgi:type II secretion system protein G
MPKMNKEQEKGFTLLELIIVMVVLAIIVAIAVPRYLNFMAEAEDRAAASDMAMIEKAVELCLVADPDGRSLLTAYGTEKAIVEEAPLIPKYLKKIPLDPNNNAYLLLVIEDPATKSYTITVSRP